MHSQKLWQGSIITRFIVKFISPLTWGSRKRCEALHSSNRQGDFWFSPALFCPCVAFDLFQSCPQRCGCEEQRVDPLETPYNQRWCTLERQCLGSEVNFYQRCLLVISHPVNRKRRRQQSSPEGNSPTKPTWLTPTVHTHTHAHTTHTHAHTHREKVWTQVCVLMSRVR